jgi:chemotaxis protein CheZ
MEKENLSQSGLKENLDERTAGLYDALGKLAKDLNEILMRQDVVESQIHSASEDLPQLSNQLTDVSRFTEEETHKILEYTEKVIDRNGALAARLKETGAIIREQVTNGTEIGARIGEMAALVENNNKNLMDILTGLSFQDLAGQRMKRMDVILQDLQSRILKLVVTYGMKKSRDPSRPSRKREMLRELESSTGARLAQCEVNKILEEFGF